MSFISKYKNYLLEYFLVILIGVFSYLTHFYRVVSRFSSHIFFFSDADDAKIYAWNTWHFTSQLDKGLSPFYTDYFFYPMGSSLWMHAHTIWFGMVNYMVRDIELAINLGIAIQLIAAFFGFYVLSKKMVVKPLFAILVAYISVFNTYILAKSGVHYNLVLIGVVPYIMILVMNTFTPQNFILNKNGINLLVLILLISMAFFMDYYMVFYGLSFLVIYLCWFFLLDDWFKKWNNKKTLIILGIVLVGHFALRLLRISGVEEKGALWGASDIRLIFTPSNDSLFYNEWSLTGVINNLNDNKVFIGFSLLVALIFAISLFIKRYKNDYLGRFLLFAGILFFLISFPIIRVDGKELFFNFTGIIHFIPFVNNLRAPDRFILMLIVLSSLFVFRVFYLFTNGNLRLKSVFLMLFFMLSFYADHAQKPMKSFKTEQVSDFLSQTKGKNVLMLPYGIRDGYRMYGEFDVDQVLLQMRYDFKMPNGYLSRISDKVWEYYDTDFYENLAKVQSDSFLSDFDWKSEMIKHHIDYVYLPTTYSLSNPKISNITNDLKLIASDTDGELYLVE